MKGSTFSLQETMGQMTQVLYKLETMRKNTEWGEGGETKSGKRMRGQGRGKEGRIKRRGGADYKYET